MVRAPYRSVVEASAFRAGVSMRLITDDGIRPTEQAFSLFPDR